MPPQNEQEIEAKFMVRDLPRLEARLRDLGGVLSAERVFEANLRFDTPARDLTRSRCALRLRQDSRARLTYKGPVLPGAEVTTRQEIEFEVSDFGAVRRLLQALGYEISAMYEKYRSSYHLGELEIVLDELPYGNFVEIEGPGAGSIRSAAEQLGLRWETRSADSYLGLFDSYCASHNLRLAGLSFEVFTGLAVTPADLGLEYGDS